MVLINLICYDLLQELLKVIWAQMLSLVKVASYQHL